jgi:hypothetical protein
MSATFQARRLLVLLVLLVLGGSLGMLGMGCASEPELADGPLHADPGILRLSPDHTHAHVEIHNRSGTPRPISGIALRGPNWDSLRFVDESHPRTIPAYTSVPIELEVSAASFQIEPGRYESGNATLVFASNRHAYELPIEFSGTAPAPIRPLMLAMLVLIGLAVLAAWGPLRAGGRDRSASSGAPGSARVLGAATFAALLIAAAAIPVGFGACRGRLGELVGPRELATCRELIAIPSVPAIWWWVASLTIAAVTLTLLRARTRPHTAGSELVLVGLRSLGITLILAPLLLGLAPADGSPSQLILVQSQMIEIAGITLPRWGLIAQPLGAALAFALVATAGPLGKPAADTNPGLAALERLELLVWVAVLVTAFLGGPAIPGFSQRPIPLLAHAPTIAVELLMFVLELVLVGALVVRLREHLAKLGVGPQQLVAFHSRWTIPLALLQLVAVLLW